MSKKQKLPLSRNYWNTCGKDQDNIPRGPCHSSLPERSKNGRIIKEPQNEWWIDSAQDNYCFWQYVQRNSLPDGRMEALQQNEIAKLFGCSATKIHFLLKSAIQKLKESGEIEHLKDFLEVDVLKEYDTPLKSTSIEYFDSGAD